MRVISFMVCDGGILNGASDAFNTKSMVCLWCLVILSIVQKNVHQLKLLYFLFLCLKLTGSVFNFEFWIIIIPKIAGTAPPTWNYRHY